MNGALDLASIGRVAAAGGGIVGAAHFDHLALGILGAPRAAHEVGPAEADFLAGGETEVLLGRDLHEVLALNEQGPGEGHLAGACRGILGVVDRL